MDKLIKEIKGGNLEKIKRIINRGGFDINELVIHYSIFQYNSIINFLHKITNYIFYTIPNSLIL